VTLGTSRKTRNVHLVGSVPLADESAVFRAAAGRLRGLVRRFPDGETGPRRAWVQWQQRVVDSHPHFELTENVPLDFAQREKRPYYRIKDGVAAEEIRFGPLGYAEHARASFRTFSELRAAGIVPAGARFLVAIPAPLAFLNVLIAQANRAAVEPAYLERLLAEIDEIAASIPHRDLAIQWDTVIELLILEGVRSSAIDDSPEALVRRLALLGDRVPPEVELGYHLCYGDMNHKHSVEPRDMAVMVTLANRLVGTLHRRLDFLHMPVPRGRDDLGYFEPLRQLELDRTELYLGLVHYTDGVEGTRRRIAAASRVGAEFGIATECGFGRRAPETVEALLDLHAVCARDA
jgi:hypothetical protein